MKLRRRGQTDLPPDAMAMAVQAAGVFAYPLETDEDEAPLLYKPRRWRRRLAWAAACLMVLVAGSAGYVYWQGRVLLDEFRAGDKLPVVQAALPELGVKPVDPAPIGIGNTKTILAIGADQRWGETERGRSDTILLLRVDPDSNTLSMLSLPRDLRVPIPGYGLDKVNAAYAYGGPGLLAKTLREYLGVTIDHFVQVDFHGFGEVVSSIGGVYLPIDGRYFHEQAPDAYNNWASIDVRPGYQRLGREDALAWVRFRHLDSDFYRAARQQIFIREVGRQLRARVSDITKVKGVLSSIAKATTSDLHDFGETLKLANTLRGIDPDRINRVTFPASTLIYNGIYYLQASEAQKDEALRAWAKPGLVIKRHRAVRKPKKKVAPGPALVSDGGRGQQLLAEQTDIDRCAPTSLPAGYAWPDADPARSYDLDGHRAIAAWATKASGVSVLWMWTTWQDPPILERPSKTVIRGGREMQLYFESGALRMVAFSVGDTRAWVTNTLRNELSKQEMLALAQTCQPL